MRGNMPENILLIESTSLRDLIAPNRASKDIKIELTRYFTKHKDELWKFLLHSVLEMIPPDSNTNFSDIQYYNLLEYLSYILEVEI